MSFTRFHDDKARILKKNIETASINHYTFNVPGNFSTSNIYYNDPHIRMQKCGNTLYKNLINVDSELKNINTLTNSRDYYKNTYNNLSMHKNIIPLYSENKTITNETRITHPVFKYREIKQYRPDYLFLNPQENVFLHFENNLDTNILEKDYYNLKIYKKI